MSQMGGIDRGWGVVELRKTDSVAQAARNVKLKELLRKRGVTLTSLAAKLHPEGALTSRSGLSQLLNGKRSIYVGSTGRLVPTWKRLKDVLTSEEFDCALQFAQARHRGKRQSSDLRRILSERDALEAELRKVEGERDALARELLVLKKELVNLKTSSITAQKQS